jgi:hypothetical protein
MAIATVNVVLECLNKGTGNIKGKDEPNHDAKNERASIIKGFRAEEKRFIKVTAAEGAPFTSVEEILFKAALAMSTQVGNCHEHADMAFAHLWHQNYHHEDPLDIMAAKMIDRTSSTRDDHVFLVMGFPGALPPNKYQSGFLKYIADKGDDHLVICDSWFHLRQVSEDGPGHGGVYTPKEYHKHTTTKPRKYSDPFLEDSVRSLFRIAPS